MRAAQVRPPALTWDRIYWEGKQLLMNMLNIEVPMISAINGPVMRHSELPLLCDIVLAAEQATFADSGHFTGGLVPGDGVHIVYPILLGLNRGRYFLMTGQTINAQEAKDLGLVAEVMPRDKLMARAWQLAEGLAKEPSLHARYTRVLFVEYLKRQMQELLGYGLALEGLATMERPLPKA
jgi:enoyl-CoA hydratase/carnithine racemase